VAVFNCGAIGNLKLLGAGPFLAVGCRGCGAVSLENSGDGGSGVRWLADEPVHPRFLATNTPCSPGYALSGSILAARQVWWPSRWLAAFSCSRLGGLRLFFAAAGDFPWRGNGVIERLIRFATQLSYQFAGSAQVEVRLFYFLSVFSRLIGHGGENRFGPTPCITAAAALWAPKICAFWPREDPSFFDKFPFFDELCPQRQQTGVGPQQKDVGQAQRRSLKTTNPGLFSCHAQRFFNLATEVLADLRGGWGPAMGASKSDEVLATANFG